MTLGAIILCRYNSSRLPGKILNKVKGKTILENIVLRLRACKNLDKIIVATSLEATDDPIAEFCASHSYQCFRGDLNDVAGRFLHTAETYELDYAMRVNGDNIFIDLETMEHMIDTVKKQNFAFVSNVPGRTFPYGMSIEIMNTAFYRSMYDTFSTTDHYEHVTKFLYEAERTTSTLFVKNEKHPELSHVQMAVDTPEDLIRTKYIADKLEGFPLEYAMTEIGAALESYNCKKELCND